MKLPKALPEVDYFLGCDPSSTNSAFALMDKNKDLVDCWVVNHKSDLISQARAFEKTTRDLPPFVGFLEGQAIRPKRRGQTNASPDSILKLARSAGAAGYWIGKQPNCKLLFVEKPEVWKGSAAKLGSQTCIIKEMGWTPEFRGEGKSRKVIPQGDPLGMNLSETYEALDAIGIAIFLRKEYLFECKKRIALKNLRS